MTHIVPLAFVLRTLKGYLYWEWGYLVKNPGFRVSCPSNNIEYILQELFSPALIYPVFVVVDGRYFIYVERQKICCVETCCNACIILDIQY